MAPSEVTPTQAKGLAALLGWRRLRVALGASFAVALLHIPGWKSGFLSILSRTLFLGLVALLVFGVFERWPRRLPGWLTRWALQVLGVALAMPLGTFAIYVLTTPTGGAPFWEVRDRLVGFASITFFGMLVAPWVAMAALYRQISGAAQRQAMAFELERSEHEREALDARLRLLQAQVEPHFLFNTLANVRELVEEGSPQASEVLGSLIAYLRAAVPRLQDSATTLGQELELVQAYLEVMHMRMPDRLQFTLQAEDAARSAFCPPMTLLTLVENAVRHGIDPSEEGGHIDVRAALRDGRCHVEVRDTGVGLAQGGGGLGTGLPNLRERLRLAFDGEAELRLASVEPHGTSVEMAFPVRGRTT